MSKRIPMSTVVFMVGICAVISVVGAFLARDTVIRIVYIATSVVLIIAIAYIMRSTRRFNRAMAQREQIECLKVKRPGAEKSNETVVPKGKMPK